MLHSLHASSIPAWHDKKLVRAASRFIPDVPSLTARREAVRRFIKILDTIRALLMQGSLSDLLSRPICHGVALAPQWSTPSSASVSIAERFAHQQTVRPSFPQEEWTGSHPWFPFIR
ncbi:hypothetical protein B0T16DRAFT_122284 [Cercophora newfieldiana]|uniref:Uncharacterized protein n=1 Tax=Cercophora newfieldiana TaxID=92897 RepID=A0AA39YA56_9PEZI|nr:hypothetical protein B0T16DRAFT_122284 [Cercophora newfieldiana]